MIQMNFEGKRALICGASRGIGRAIALALAENGCTLTILARDPVALNALLVILPRPVQQTHDSCALDLSDLEELKQRMDQLSVKNDYQILVNNTGGPPSGRLEIAAIPAFELALRQHLMASHTIVQAVVPGMRKCGYGRIINILSTSVKQPLDHLGVSNTVRAAMANWAKTLANELAIDGITVNNILPGATSTDRLKSLIKNESQAQFISMEQIEERMIKHIPMGRFAGPEEIAYAALFLASPLASYITGINIPVDGGRTKSL